MCDRCEIDLAMYGEISDGFRCSEVPPELLAEEANGIARFPGLKKKASAAGEPSAAPAPSSRDADGRDED